ncbi:Deoxyhypusine synthase [Venturia nashicola]|uniref:Deoxyhypusine synthase n=1 Tax=Venturia nashicola TaxID=86259 RepID=A0A4Z1PLQ4_9PEZI|nr:Deoxyhypusine synthase [Venturia nashicola]TLD38730.1 Deoxyhypusine synthase [Venturia nashicola]
MFHHNLLPILLAISSTISAAALLPKPSPQRSPRGQSLILPASGLPSPTGGLKYIAVGLGTQNYTCAATPGSSTAAPVSVGALARLFNARHYLELHTDQIDKLSGSVLDLSTKSKGAMDPQSMGIPYLGQHFFTAAPASPEFDLIIVGARLVAKKLANVAAPSGAHSGPHKAGAVDWLALGDNGAGLGLGGVVSAYRVETAGGKASATCSGNKGAFTVPYAAQYWFYG